MSLCILIAMKDSQHSKQRLANTLIPRERELLALNLFRNTLSFLKCHFASTPVFVVTPSQLIADMAASYNAKAVLEPEHYGSQTASLNCAVSFGTKACMDMGYSAQLLIPADIIDLDVEEFKQLINSPIAPPSVTVCPSRDGGTNALLTSPPNIIEFQFGENSSARHLGSAKALKIQQCELKLSKLALDLDTAEDLAQLESVVIRLLKQPFLSSTTQLQGAI